MDSGGGSTTISNEEAHVDTSQRNSHSIILEAVEPGVLAVEEELELDDRRFAEASYSILKLKRSWS